MDDQVQAISNEGLVGLFDSQFSIAEFAEAIEKSELKSKETISSAKELLKNSMSDSDDTKKYRLDISDEIKEALDTGQAEFVKGKNGEVYAQLRGEKGRFGQKIPVTEEMDEKGLSFDDLQMALQIEAIANQLNNVIDTLKEIETQISEVRADQRNDRLGLFYSGISLYIEAKQISDEGLQKLVLSQALKSISDSNSQMIQEIRTSIDFLTNAKYKKRKDAISLIDENLSTIKQCYEIVYRSAIMKAMIYHESNEIKAMAVSLEEYGRFIDKMITPYIGLLSELDANSKLITEGPWGKISNTLISCSSMISALNCNNTLVIEMRD